MIQVVVVEDLLVVEIQMMIFMTRKNLMTSRRAGGGLARLGAAVAQMTLKMCHRRVVGYLEGEDHRAFRQQVAVLVERQRKRPVAVVS
jgi:hypothetical protein